MQRYFFLINPTTGGDQKNPYPKSNELQEVETGEKNILYKFFVMEPLG